MTEKAKRLESANFERALAAVKWKDAANAADETGRAEDKVEAAKDSAELDAADQKIKRVQAEP